ncbi:SMI1/KNR4 family protein [Zooshikella ganghwensis]|uniref:SMI1/KNR4 family protein n=1 Tax=Zooshikella ganghwensis TaxID=202772 RepID=A0A4P9VMT8_9GAMM|nr:SMI1/KNR4 family protein [Zooshikella ganghwensis]RDH43704.1 SMI1/KNR4 family protein [Zooshikella ganghwensis]
MEIDVLIDEIRVMCEQIDPSISATLNPPAAEEEIASVEGQMGLTFPEAFKNYLLFMNGQTDPTRLHVFCEEGTLASLDEILSLWKMYNQVYEGQGDSSWSDKLIPFVDVEGSTTFIDSNTGSIVNMYDGENETLPFDGFNDWLLQKHKVLKGKKYVYQDGFMGFVGD